MPCRCRGDFCCNPCVQAAEELVEWAIAEAELQEESDPEITGSCIQQSSISAWRFGPYKPWTDASNAKAFIVKDRGDLKSPQDKGYETKEQIILRTGILGQQEEHAHSPRARKDMRTNIRTVMKKFPRHYRLKVDKKYAEEYRNKNPDHPEFEDCEGALRLGRALESESVTINSLSGSQLPRYIYRIVSAIQPHGGLKPRSHGLYETDPLHFHEDVRRHAEVTNRGLSPFLSAICDFYRAQELALRYAYRHGFKGVQLLTLDTWNLGWKDPDSAKRFWSHGELAWKGLLPPSSENPFLEGEIYIEGSIPESAIVKRKDYPNPVYNPKPRGKKRPNPPVDHSHIPRNKNMKAAQ